MFEPSKTQQTHSKIKCLNPTKPIQNPANPFIGAINSKPSPPIHAEPKPSTAPIHVVVVNLRERENASHVAVVSQADLQREWWLAMVWWLWFLGLKRERREQSCREITRERERELIWNSLIKSRRKRELNNNI